MKRALILTFALVATAATAQDLPCQAWNPSPPFDGGGTNDSGNPGAPQDSGVPGGTPTLDAAVWDFNADDGTTCTGTGDITAWVAGGSDGWSLDCPNSSRRPACQAGGITTWELFFSSSPGDYCQGTGSGTDYTSGTFTICFVGGFDSAGSARNGKYFSDGDTATERGPFLGTHTASPYYWRTFQGTVINSTAGALDNNYEVVCYEHDGGTGTAQFWINGADEGSGNSNTTNDVVSGLTLGSYYSVNNYFPNSRWVRFMFWDSKVAETAMSELITVYGTFPQAM